MNFLNMIGSIAILLLASGAQASTITLFCEEARTPEACSTQAEAALRSIGCILEITEINCGRAEGPFYCELKSGNCFRAHLGNFGGETCYDSQKVTIPKEHRVHNGYWLGFFGSYSRTLCRKL